MKKNTSPLLQSAEIKQLMHAYFTNAAPLFCCRPSSQRDALSRDLLNLVLEVLGAKDQELLCQQIIEATDAMQNVNDNLLLRLNDLAIPGELVCFFDMKAACMQQPGLPQTASLDIAMVHPFIREAGASERAWAIRTGACLNWLEADPWCSKENATRLWKLLAFSGDLFAMRALEYSVRSAGDLQRAAIWKEVHRLCETASNQFLTVLPASLSVTASKESADLAQLIISIRSKVCHGNGCLSMSTLQYAAESPDNLQQKLRMLCGEQNGFQWKLVQEQNRDSRQFGF